METIIGIKRGGRGMDKLGGLVRTAGSGTTRRERGGGQKGGRELGINGLIVNEG